MNTTTLTWLSIWAVSIITLSGIGIVTAGNIPDNEWSLNLSGNHQEYITQEEYEQSINVEQTSNYFSSVVDEKGQVWDGMPLWRLTNRVNDTGNLAYLVTVTGTDGSTITLPGSEIAGNDAFILANTKNGEPIEQGDPSYPLVLAGRNLPAEEMISGVSSLTLTPSDSI
ncbi:molybdopterin-binding protein [Methanospirillum lacunae]|uniref:Oxidoreductase molybdopterin-binding domain-containing protein n=1 Tax=Methanospirillum lacunae TaxID=668570 RepID=A0A2V2NC71_9EURY|nr:hypothetical protein [Methanospirillum lacunae]PWR74048.1 hypothetical protein DK846_02505 [Methanospirillum lacunae]